MQPTRQPFQQTAMAHMAVEDCLNLYSRDRKKQLEQLREEQKSVANTQSSLAIDDILNRGA